MIIVKCKQCNKRGLWFMFKKAEWVWGKPLWAKNVYACSIECADKLSGGL